jgi:hypothetical protein
MRLKDRPSPSITPVEKAHADHGSDRQKTHTTFSGRKRNMSSPTQPFTGPPGPADLAPTTVAYDGTAPSPESALGEREPLIRALRSAPPEAVLEEVARADAARERLAAIGQHVHFAGEGNGRARIELRDADGALLRELTPGEAIELACGEWTD